MSIESEKEKLQMIKDKMGVYKGHLHEEKLPSENTLLKQKLLDDFYKANDYEVKKEIMYQIEELTGTKNSGLRADLENFRKNSGPRL